MSRDWYWNSSELTDPKPRWEKYPPEQTAVINHAFNQGSCDVKIETSRGPYIVSLRYPLTQHPVNDKSKIREVKHVPSGTSLHSSTSSDYQEQRGTSLIGTKAPINSNGDSFRAPQPWASRTSSSISHSSSFDSLAPQPDHFSNHKHAATQFTAASNNSSTIGYHSSPIPRRQPQTTSLHTPLFGYHASHQTPSSATYHAMNSSHPFIPPPGASPLTFSAPSYFPHQSPVSTPPLPNIAIVAPAQLGVPPSTNSAAFQTITDDPNKPHWEAVWDSLRPENHPTHRNHELRALVLDGVEWEKIGEAIQLASAKPTEPPVLSFEKNYIMPLVTHSYGTHPHFIGTPQMSPAVQYQLWEREFTLSLPSTSKHPMKWEIIHPTLLNQYVLFTCIKKPHAYRGPEPPAKSFETSGVLHPGESVVLLISLVFLHPHKQQNQQHFAFLEQDFIFIHLIHIRVDFGLYRGYSLMALVAHGEESRRETYWEVPKNEVVQLESIDKKPNQTCEVSRVSFRGLACVRKCWKRCDKRFPPEDFEMELKLLRKFVHPNLIPFIGASRSDDEAFVLEGSGAKNLKEYYEDQRREGKWSAGLALELALQAAKGFHHLHCERVVHRDIKSLNIVVDIIGDEPTIKIIDLGLARPFEHPDLVHKRAYTPLWAAPEAFADKPCYTDKSDVFSFGIVLGELMTAAPPSERSSDRAIHKGTVDKICEIPIAQHYCSRIPGLFELQEQCVRFTPNERPSFNEIVSRLGACRSHYNQR